MRKVLETIAEWLFFPALIGFMYLVAWVYSVPS